MADRVDITPEYLSKRLRYNPETGKLFWLERSSDMFTGTDGRSAEHKCNNWNAKLAGMEAFTASTTDGYRFGNIDGFSLKAHRVAWALYHGRFPEALIDHINGDPSDNRIANLRDVDQRQNMRNARRRVDNTSGHAGVSWFAQTNRWQVRVSGKHVGFFHDLGDALAARDLARRGMGFLGRDGATIITALPKRDRR